MEKKKRNEGQHKDKRRNMSVNKIYLKSSKLIKIDHKPTDHKVRKGKNLRRCSDNNIKSESSHSPSAAKKKNTPYSSDSNSQSASDSHHSSREKHKKRKAKRVHSESQSEQEEVKKTKKYSKKHGFKDNIKDSSSEPSNSTPRSKKNYAQDSEEKVMTTERNSNSSTSRKRKKSKHRQSSSDDATKTIRSNKAKGKREKKNRSKSSSSSSQNSRKSESKSIHNSNEHKTSNHTEEKSKNTETNKNSELTNVRIETNECSATHTKTEDDSGTNSRNVIREEDKNPIQSSFSNRFKNKTNDEESKKTSKNNQDNHKNIHSNCKTNISFRNSEFNKNLKCEETKNFNNSERNSSNNSWFEDKCANTRRDPENKYYINTKHNIEMKQVLRKFIVYYFAKKKNEKWEDVKEEHVRKIEDAFYVTEREDKNNLLKVMVRDNQLIDFKILERKIKNVEFTTKDILGNLTEEKIQKIQKFQKFVIRNDNEIVPYNLLPIEIFECYHTYKIKGLSDIIGKVIEQIRVSTQNMDTETSITVLIPSYLKSYITSSSKLPGQMYFFQKLKSKDYYFNPNYIIEDSISINQGKIQMNVSVFNSEIIQKDLEEYVSSIKLKEVDFQLLANIENFDDKKNLFDDIQNIIYPKLLKEDQIVISFNIENNKAIFVCSCEITDDKIKEFNEKLLKINEVVSNKQEFTLINISEGDARELITNEVNINTLCISLSQQDSRCLILSLYCMKVDLDNNKNRVLQIFSQYHSNEETLKLSIKNLNKSVFESMLKNKKVIEGVRENYFVTKLELSKVKNKNKEKVYYLKASILSSKLEAFKNDRDNFPFSFKNLFTRYHEQLDQTLESEEIKLKTKALVRFVRNLGYLHNFKANHPKFCLRIRSDNSEESDCDKKSIQSLFENIFEKTCKARFPFEFENSDTNLPLLMVYNAFAHFKSEEVKSIVVPYGKKQYKIEELKVTLKSGSK